MRLTRIDYEDLNLFEFDYDLTFMVFFLNADEQVYARYGGRDAASPDSRQSLAGLRYTMESVLRMHQGGDKVFAPKSGKSAQFIKDLMGGQRDRRCLHCHQVREILNSDLQKKGRWSRDLIWRYPLPENVGLELELDRGNVIKNVHGRSPASTAGLQTGDLVRLLNAVPIHSFADAQYALDRAPKTGSIDIAWQRGQQVLKGKLTLLEGWRGTDLTWRPSMKYLLPAPRLYGLDLTAAEKTALGLPAKRLAFRQQNKVPEQARVAGVLAGDVIVGIDEKTLETDLAGFITYIQQNYLIGDRVTINILRNGKPMNLSMTFVR